MIKMTKEEQDFLEKILTLKLPLVNYNSDNKIEFVNPEKFNKYKSKFMYVPWSYPENEAFMERAKQKGLGQLTKSPFYIQQKLTEAKRNDRFKQLPVMAIGLDADGNTYFYKLGEGNKHKDIRLSAVLRIPTRVKVTSDLDNTYHVYSPFRSIQKYGMYDKNYSLKVLSWLVTEGINDQMKKYFHLFLKGMLITHGIEIDNIVTMKSSKPLNKSVLNSLKSDPFFSKSKVIEIEKPDIRKIKKEYIDGKYPSSEFFDSLSLDLDSIKMKDLSPADRKILANIILAIYKKDGSVKDIKDKNILFIDDLITTGSTFSKILIPLFEENNKLIPFSYVIK